MSTLDSITIPDGFKRCAKCALEYPATLEYFHRDKKHRDGLCSSCKQCESRRAEKYYAEHAEHRREYFQKWYAEHQLQQVEWRTKHAEQQREKVKQWQSNNPDKVRARDSRRKARELAAPGTHTSSDIKHLFHEQKGCCAYCGVSLENGYHADHIIPLAGGGSNWPDNLALACPTCNISKKDKFLFTEWIPLNPNKRILQLKKRKD
jgi:5-methylcytosine-specific restriction endonuclease McrA